MRVLSREFLVWSAQPGSLLLNIGFGREGKQAYDIG